MKNASGVRVVERDDATVMPELAEELRVALTEIAGVAREGLLAMSVEVGLRVMAQAVVRSRDTQRPYALAKQPEQM
jgi:hypothetical protein